ncbi:unnamed protein product [Hymenolepis diminuta]|uniref:Uncharacterized protein n=1 Tax=Hymenolepis diminuta TaxID=6216 RepID=A0A564YC07_HYMDI|nr:unnamed protein product [Hymenolepis diminuta]
MKQNGNLHERVTERRGTNYAMVSESKLESKLKAIKRTENGDLASQLMMSVLCFDRHAKRKEMDRCYEKGKGAIISRVKAVAETFGLLLIQNLMENLRWQ